MAPSLKSLLQAVIPFIENEYDAYGYWYWRHKITSTRPEVEFRFEKNDTNIILILRIVLGIKKLESEDTLVVSGIFDQFKENEISILNYYKKSDLSLNAFKIFNKTKIMLNRGINYKNEKAIIANAAEKYGLMIDENRSWSSQAFAIANKVSGFEIGKIVIYDEKYSYMATKGGGWTYKGDNIDEAMQSLLDQNSIVYNDN
jgi:hypothetical protein